MKDFIAIVDYRAGNRPFSVVELKSKDIIEAMNEAEKLFNESVYLVKLAKRTCKAVKTDYGKDYHYLTTLCNRGHGWHANDYEHGESSFEVVISVTTNGFTFHEIKLV